MVIMMMRNRALFFMSAAITLSLLIASIGLTTPAMASSKGIKGGGGPVTQEQVSTGNPTLDKEINKFYSCISKTHQDPPTIEKVDSCYYQALSGAGGSTTTSHGLTGPDANPPSPSTSTSQHHKK